MKKICKCGHEEKYHDSIRGCCWCKCGLFIETKKKIIKRRRIDGWATYDGYFFLAPPTGTFASCPKLYKAYLIIKLPEGAKTDGD